MLDWLKKRHPSLSLSESIATKTLSVSTKLFICLSIGVLYIFHSTCMLLLVLLFAAIILLRNILCSCLEKRHENRKEPGEYKGFIIHSQDWAMAISLIFSVVAMYLAVAGKTGIFNQYPSYLENIRVFTGETVAQGANFLSFDFARSLFEVMTQQGKAIYLTLLLSHLIAIRLMLKSIRYLYYLWMNSKDVKKYLSAITEDQSLRERAENTVRAYSRSWQEIFAFGIALPYLALLLLRWFAAWV